MLDDFKPTPEHFTKFGVSQSLMTDINGEQVYTLFVSRESAEIIRDHLTGWLNNKTDDKPAYQINFRAKETK